jgi:hypothetical protein
MGSDEAAKLQFTIVVVKSDYGGERGGVYKPTKKKSKFEDRNKNMWMFI